MTRRKGVLGIVFRKTSDGFRFLILHRRLYWKGWEFAKGGIENEDEEAAVRREINEETGLENIKLIQKVPYKIEYNYPSNFFSKYTGAEQTVFLVESKTAKITLSREHDNYKWATEKEAKELLKYNTNKKALDAALEIIKSS